MTQVNWARLALGASATGDGFGGWSNPGNAIDDNGGTYASTNQYDGYHKNLYVTLSESHWVETIRFTQNGDARYRQASYQLYSSQDGVQWDLEATLTNVAADYQFTINPKAAKYWRIYGTSNNQFYWQVFTWSLTGDDAWVPPPTTDLSDWLDYLEETWASEAETWLAANGY